ncbi:MAG: maleate isomerase [Solirubrobacteraceae bacterium]|nr:maleate isomerase [Solirubrobacteraceae bacterium]
MSTARRIGLIVPSSNTTMETELPLMFRRREEVAPETFTFHSSRAHLKEVSSEELSAMVRDSERCAAEVADAGVDAIAYACLVAVMNEGSGAHAEIEHRLAARAAEVAGRDVPLISSAGALVEALQAIGARRIAVIAPYVRPLTGMVCEYIGACGPEVLRSVSLEVADNLEVGRLDPANLVGIASELDTSDVDALVLSACVQMPSLASIQPVEDRLGIPVVSAATATAYSVLNALRLRPEIPGAGSLLSGRVPVRQAATA